MATVTRAGVPVHLAGYLPKAGEPAPAFILVDAEMNELTIENFTGKTLILNIFPSIDTPTCAMSVREFNARLNEIEGVEVLNVSADLPFAQKRFCAAEGLEHVSNASTFRHPEFARNYGVEILDGYLKGLLSRAIVVIRDGQVTYSELVPEIKQQPNYESALEAAKSST